MPNLRLPSPADLEELLTMLLGRDVSVAPADGPADGKLLGFYEFDDGTPAAVTVTDIETAAAAGAALSMLPAGVAQDAIRGGTLDGAMRSNFAEVLNIGANLYMNDGADHLRLVSTHDVDGAPAEAAGLIDGAPQSVDLRVTVKGYGSGTMSFRAA